MITITTTKPTDLDEVYYNRIKEFVETNRNLPYWSITAIFQKPSYVERVKLLAPDANITVENYSYGIQVTVTYGE